MAALSIKGLISRERRSRWSAAQKTTCLSSQPHSIDQATHFALAIMNEAVWRQSWVREIVEGATRRIFIVFLLPGAHPNANAALR